MKARASRMLSRMSSSRFRGSDGLEGINRICRHGGTNVGFQRLAVDDIDRTGKKTGDVILQANIGIDVLDGLRRDVDHDVDVAVRAIVATRPRAEQGGMRDATLAQRALVLPEPV